MLLNVAASYKNRQQDYSVSVSLFMPQYASSCSVFVYCRLYIGIGQPLHFLYFETDLI